MIDRRTHRCLLQLVRLDDDGDDGGDDDGELARRSVHFIVIIVNGRIACDDAGIASQASSHHHVGKSETRLGGNPNLNPKTLTHVVSTFGTTRFSVRRLRFPRRFGPSLQRFPRRLSQKSETDLVSKWRHKSP